MSKDKIIDSAPFIDTLVVVTVKNAVVLCSSTVVWLWGEREVTAEVRCSWKDTGKELRCKRVELVRGLPRIMLGVGGEGRPVKVGGG